MEPLEFGDLPEDALVLVDSAPIIYFLEGHPKHGPRFRPLFEAHAAGRLRFAVTTITIAEVLTGPLQAADDALARRYRAILESWHPVTLDADIAESAAHNFLSDMPARTSSMPPPFTPRARRPSAGRRGT